MEDKVRQSIEGFYKEYPTLPKTDGIHFALELITRDFLKGFEPHIFEEMPIGDIVFYATDLPLFGAVIDSLVCPTINSYSYSSLTDFLISDLGNHFKYENGEDKETHNLRIMLQIVYGDYNTIKVAQNAFLLTQNGKQK